LSYDLNGNITSLQRNSKNSAGMTEQIDDLNYSYAGNGNRLTSVTYTSGNYSGYPDVGGNLIDYDSNGNMTSHLDKGISSIQYNYLNLPKQITQNAQVTNYVYRADGVKVKKLFGDIETDYLDGFQYKSTFAIESWNGVGTYHPDPNEVPVLKLRIIPTSEGYFDVLKNQYIYNFTDHLGNLRLSYSDTNKDGIIQPRRYNASQCTGRFCIDDWRPGEIVEVNNYYPFGLLHQYTATTQNAYQYKYNGKELQESGMYDFGARMYMPDLGRWGVFDPLAESYRRWSPYHYAMNNPANLTDPDGMGSYDSQGNWKSEMEDFYNYHHMDSSYRPKSFKTDGLGEANDGGGGGGYLTVGQLLDALVETDNSSTDYFAGIDFSQFGNDEEPVNFFSSKEDDWFLDTVKAANKKYKNTKNDGIFRVYGHGTVGYMMDVGETVGNVSKLVMTVFKNLKH
jgi:RHS repeat-associated protein